MKTLIAVIDDNKRNKLDTKAFHDLGITVLTDIRAIAGLSPMETLIVTDNDKIAETASINGFPVVGYEHDGIRLSCGEIILSLSVLTPTYAVELHNRMTGRYVSFRCKNMSLYPLTEDEYMEFYNLFRGEPYMLTEAGRGYTDVDVSSMYKRRIIQAQFTNNCGMFRVVPDETDEAVGYGCVLEEHSDTGLRTTISYYVYPKYRGHGFGLDIVQTLVAFIRGNTPERDIYADIYTENVISAHVLTKAGFVLVSQSSGSKTHNSIADDVPTETQEAPQTRTSDQRQQTNGSPSLSQSVYCLRGHQ